MTIPRKVVSYAVHGSVMPPGHEDITRARIAEQVAVLLGGVAGGPIDAQGGETAPDVYFVPSDTLTRAHAEGQLGIASDNDLFGGVVPHRYVSTKIITHRLLGRDAAAPDTWSREFENAIADIVLPGYAAFTASDAREAAATLLQSGPVRLKCASETGGRGQFVATTTAEVNALIDALRKDEIERDGIVLELNLLSVETRSVGQVAIGEWRASYHGVQHLTRDHNGAMVYGGSTLFVVRGDIDNVLARPLTRNVRVAVEQARRYDAAANACFQGFYASRRNYDIAQGVDARGQWHSGVLEQSWRVGGASGAEVCALEAFAANPGLHTLRAACAEVYGPCSLPAGARLYYQSDDPHVGYLTKYVTVERA